MQTQAALYREIDLALSWSEQELPERERTKHVHRLHPYLGKFVPQLAEAFLRRYGAAGSFVWDPFAGSGTTLVEANALAMPAAGCDISAFNCLLTRVKTDTYEPDALLADVVRLAMPGGKAPRGAGTAYLRRWFAARTVRELRAFRERITVTNYPDLWRVVLSRAARSARLTRHDDLDFPREPVQGDYFCHKHRRVCRPVGEADKFLRRYVRDAAQRVQEFAEVRSDAPVTVLNGDARLVDPPAPVDLVFTSPPYPGLIDYHEQHAYAFELLGLETARRRRDRARRQGLLRGRRGRSPPSSRFAPAPRQGRRRRERLPQPLRRDHRRRRPDARRPSAPPREPPHRPPERRVLRRDPRRDARTNLAPPRNSARGRERAGSS